MHCKFSALFIFTIVLSILSCQQNKSDDNRTVFRYNESQGISTLDPAFAKSQVIMWPVNQIFNGLVQINDTLGIDPCIAKEWKVSSDGLLYTFILRNDVYFHNHPEFENEIGRRVVATDFKYSFERILLEKTASPGRWIFSAVDNFNADGFTAINDTVFQIKLTRPFPAFLGILTMQYCSVVPHEIVNKLGDDFGKLPVGTGPFYFKYWKDGEKLILLKNEKYFEFDNKGERLPYLDAVAISFVKDKQSEFLEFMKGEIDFLSGVHTSYKNELITQYGQLNPKYNGVYNMLKESYLNTEYLAIFYDKNSEMMKNHPLRFKEIRQAINYGFDREKMVKYMRNNLCDPAFSGFIPKGLPGFRKGWGYKYNKEKARELVNIVKNEIGEIPPFTLTTTADYLDLCEFIQHELEGIGLTLKIDVSVGSTFRSSIANSKLPFFRGSWIADYPDAENYLALFYSKNFCPAGPNYTHFSNIDFDELYEKTLLESDPVKRAEMYFKMDSIVHEKSVIVPLYYDQVVRFMQNNIEGFSTNPINLLVLKKVKKLAAN